MSRLLRLRAVRLAVALTGLAGGGVGALFIPRDTPPTAGAVAEARRDLDTAIREGARTWAPQPFQSALVMTEAAVTSLRREHARLPLLRDYGPVRRALATAAEAGRLVLEATRTSLGSARSEAEEALAAADAALDAARAAADIIRIQSHGRRALMQTELALDEARRLHARGEHVKAVARARWVVAQSRTWEDRSLKVLNRFASAPAVRQWRRWVADTIAWSARTGDAAIVVDKATRELVLYNDGRPQRTFRVDLGLNPVMDKLREGDNATPEGRYRVSQVKPPGASRYYRAFLLDYPNEEDWEVFRRAQRDGRIPRGARIGGLIEIHGEGGRGDDWTRGCVALTNREMDWLARHVRLGTPVTIVGSRSGASPRSPVERVARAEDGADGRSGAAAQR